MKVVVIGSMNCMPTDYAIALKKYCSEVVHFYDADEDDSLSNPMLRYGENSREWTKGICIKKIRFRHILTYLFPRIFHFDLLNQINNADIALLSGPSISLARLIKGQGKRIMALSYGGDISVFCNPEWPEIDLIGVQGIKKWIKPILLFLKSTFVKLQIAGLKSCTHYSYFVAGWDIETDSLLERLLRDLPHQPKRLPRFSVNIDILEKDKFVDPLTHLANTYKILFPVRFSENELSGNKGWRMLFEGLKKYKNATNNKFACICFKKGDYIEAQRYAKEMGVDDVVEWHNVVPFAALVQYYRSSDVVIEQLGPHWIGQGLWVMALGIPLIGKTSTEKQIEFFEGSGLLSVNDIDSLVNHLVNCESESYRKNVGKVSREFIRTRANVEVDVIEWGIF